MVGKQPGLLGGNNDRIPLSSSTSWTPTRLYYLVGGAPGPQQAVGRVEQEKKGEKVERGE